MTSLELKPFASMKKQLGRGTACKGMTVQLFFRLVSFAGEISKGGDL